MVSIVEATTRKLQKDFIEFPLKLYKDNPYFVPPLYGDEKALFSKNFTYNDTCKSVFYNAYRDGEMVGRINGILQIPSNELRNEKRIRFTRFDTIDDPEVAKALFDAVEDWGRKLGMDTICGPLGYSDLEREGLLVDGFDQLSTFEEQYNYEYYGKLIEDLGYVKEVDWTESKLTIPEDYDGHLEKMAEYVMKRYKLHYGTANSVNEYLKKYADPLFELLDEGYKDLYGTVPFTENMKKSIISSFKLIVDLKHVAVILDEEENLICFGVSFPSIAKAVQKSGGRLTPGCLIRVLKTIKHPEVIDLGLIAVKPEYINRGITACISAELIKMLREDGIDHIETNLNLEYNYPIQNCWKRFHNERHKLRRSYVKSLIKEEEA